MMASYPGPILHKCLGTIVSFPTIAAPSVCQYRTTGGRERPENEATLAKLKLGAGRALRQNVLRRKAGREGGGA